MVHEITKCETLTLLDKLVNLKELNKDETTSLYSIKDRLEIIHCTKNEVFHLRISSVNVAKSAGNCGFGHIY